MPCGEVNPSTCGVLAGHVPASSQTVSRRPSRGRSLSSVARIFFILLLANLVADDAADGCASNRSQNTATDRVTHRGAGTHANRGSLLRTGPRTTTGERNHCGHRNRKTFRAQHAHDVLL